MAAGNLTFQVGGLGLRSATTSAPAVFLASINSTKVFAEAIFPDTNHQELLLPGEYTCTRALLATLPSLSLEDVAVAKQKGLQAWLDEHTHSTLTQQLDISGRVRLEAISNSPDPSRWLTIPALGLCLPPAEFIVAARVWLGIHSFPIDTHITCPCGAAIDPIGVHLLSCGHGPYRIRRHDALRDTIYQALLLDSKDTRREQRLSTDSQERPGDIFHPDFYNGRPTFFDVAVTSR